MKNCVKMSVDFNQMKSWYQEMKENKSGAPSRLYPCMFKTFSVCDAILSIFVHIITISIKLEHVLMRCSNVHQTLLEKVENVPKINKFWNILWIEHELNFLLSLIWAQQLPKFFEKEKLLHESQKGIRKRIHAHKMLYNKVFSYDLCRIMRTTAAFQENDGKNCYDRAIPDIAELDMCCLGLDEAPAK